MLKPEDLTDTEYLLAARNTRSQSVREHLARTLQLRQEELCDLYEDLKNSPDSSEKQRRYAKTLALHTRGDKIMKLHTEAEKEVLQFLRDMGETNGDYVSFDPRILEEIKNIRQIKMRCNLTDA